MSPEPSKGMIEPVKRTVEATRFHFVAMAKWLDRRLRRYDYRFNRTYGGPHLLPLWIPGHPRIATLLPIATLFWIVEGPTGGRRG